MVDYRLWDGYEELGAAVNFDGNITATATASATVTGREVGVTVFTLRAVVQGPTSWCDTQKLYIYSR